MRAIVMRPGEIEELTDSTRDLLREFAALHAEGEALRRELEMTWGGEDDERPTLIPDDDDDDYVREAIEIDRRDTIRC